MSVHTTNRTALPTTRMVWAVCLTIAVGVSCSASPRAADRAKYSDAPLVPLDGGPSRPLSTFRGTPVVINLWAPWCAPCVTEMPELDRVHRRLGGRVAIVGVTDGLDEAGSRRLAESTGVTYPLLVDKGGDIQAALGVVNLPTTVFLDADGHVVNRHAGALTAKSLTALIRSLYDIS